MVQSFSLLFRPINFSLLVVMSLLLVSCYRNGTPPGNDWSNLKCRERLKFVWHHVNRMLLRFSRTMPVTFMSPHVPWDDKLHDGDTVARWATAALTVPYTEEVECSVVNALLQIVSIDSLRPHLPTDLWTWLNIRKMALDFFLTGPFHVFSPLILRFYYYIW